LRVNEDPGLEAAVLLDLNGTEKVRVLGHPPFLDNTRRSVY